MPPPAPLEPLFFHRILKEKVWGGRTLARRLGVAPLFSGPLGETWELSDYPGEETRVRGGRCDGLSLRQLMESHAGALLGAARPCADGRFPLLVKLIEAGADLSVQIHPPDGPRSPTGSGKTEAWYVLEAEPGAAVICGLRPGTTRAAFEPDAGGRRVERHLHRVPVRAGDCVFVPAGMTHAIGRGVILCEVQQTCDVTFRIYDWDRPGLDGKPRPLHLREALAVVDYELPPGRALRPRFPAPAGGVSEVELVDCPYFRLAALRVVGAARRGPLDRPRAMAVVGGSGAVLSPEGAFPPRELRFGDTVLLPAALGEVEIRPGPAGLQLLEGSAC